VLAELSAIFKTDTAANWVKRLEEADVPVSPVNSMPEVFDNPQIRHRQMQLHTDVDGLDLLRNPLRLSETPIVDYRPPPALGEHTDEILHEILGLTDGEIGDLRRAGAL
jgi:crotonobetainyl-CoA:carnitine CoA-transferase CaiB-like acyl-CoA transferase